MKKIVILSFFFATINAFAQTKLTIQNSNEPWGVVYSDDRNLVSNQGLAAGRTNAGSGTGNFYTIRSYLQFDLSSIPVGSKVNSAKLNLFGGGSFFDLGPNSAILRRVTSAWNPATLIWNNQPSSALRGTVRLPMSTGFPNPDYKNINVWTLVQAMVDSPSTSFGFSIRLDTDARGSTNRIISFNPPGDPHKSPKLVIEYTPPGMNPAVTSMSADGTGTTTQMSLYPNPSNGTFNCSIKSDASDAMILRIMDMLGRTVYEQPLATPIQQLNVKLPIGSSGTYLVILQDNSGTVVYQRMLVN